MNKFHKTQFILLSLLNIAIVIAGIITISYVSDASGPFKDQKREIKSQVESLENNSTEKQAPFLVGELCKTLESCNTVIASSFELIRALSKFVIILSTLQLFILIYAFYRNKKN